MSTVPGAARITGISPQFLVDDLQHAIAYYRDKLGFAVEFVYESFYASVRRDGFAIHLKESPKLTADRAHRKDQEHLDAYIAVSGVRSLFGELQTRGANLIRPLEEQPWACVDFYVEDPDGYILCFSEQMAKADGKGIIEKAFGYKGDHMNLPVPDLVSALPFYEKVLGFTVVSRSDTPHRSAVLARNAVRIKLSENGGDPTQDGCAFHVKDLASLFAEFKANGLRKEISEFDIERHDDSAWRVFYVVAPDGLCYWFGERQARADSDS